MAKTMRVAGLKVRLPKGASGLSPRNRSAVEVLLSNPPRGGLKRSENCTVVLFHSKSGKAVAAQRCENRKLKGHNRKQCRRGGKGPKRHLYARCR